jgi:hypothetical protein
MAVAVDCRGSQITPTPILTLAQGEARHGRRYRRVALQGKGRHDRGGAARCIGALAQGRAAELQVRRAQALIEGRR